MSRRKGRGDGRTLQLPGNVQNALNKEERVLQQELTDLRAQVDYRLKSITQEQQLSTKKLIVLEKRLTISKARSTAMKTAVKVRSTMAPMVTTRPSIGSNEYYQSLLAPKIRLERQDNQKTVEKRTVKFSD